MGIRNIKGNIVGDDNLFEDIGLGAGWSWDYETDWYAAQSSALSYNDNCVDITIKYDAKRDTVLVESKTSFKKYVILNQVKVVKGTEKNINRYNQGKRN